MKLPGRHVERSSEDRRFWWRAFVSTVAVIALMSSIVTNAVLIADHHNTTTILANGLTEDQTLKNAGTVQIAFAGHLLAVDAVLCHNVAILVPAGEKCPPEFTIPKEGKT